MMDRLGDLMGFLAGVAESASCSHSAKICRTLAEPPSTSRGSVKGEQKFALLLGSITRVVLLENAPSLFLTIAFLALNMHSLSSSGIAKVVLGLLAAFGGALSKAK